MLSYNLNGKQELRSLKYGNVNISLEDGSISPLEAKEEVPAVTA